MEGRYTADEAVIVVAVQRYVLGCKQDGHDVTLRAALSILAIAEAMGLQSAGLQALGFPLRRRQLKPAPPGLMLDAIARVRETGRTNARQALSRQFEHLSVRELEAFGARHA